MENFSFLYPFEWEKNWGQYDNVPILRIFWWLPYIASFMYVASVFIGKRIMRDREGFTLKYTTIVWNGLL